MDPIHLPQLSGGVGREFAGFQHLIPRRVQRILLVSSLYDSYILEEDGRLSDLLNVEYLELNLSHAPTMVRVSNAEEALEEIRARRYDLVITASRLGDMDPEVFSREIKELAPTVPIMLLAYHLRELSRLMERGALENFEGTFLWNGDARILLAMIKLAEDRLNVDHDTKYGQVRVILLVEDSVRFYSSYLPVIYTEVMKLTKSLMEEGVNMSHKLLRMRARPKIIHATTYEEGVALFTRYREYLLGIISDVRFPKNGRMNARAGLDFVEMVKREEPDLAVAIQTTEGALANEAMLLGTSLIDKGSPRLHKAIRGFMQEHLGFGEFVFRMPDGREVCRVADMTEMVRALRSVPEPSLLYHSGRNHFSHWLRARTEFTLAGEIRPIGIKDFETVEKLRSFLVETFSEHREQIQRGVIAEFSRRLFDADYDFVRIGAGSLGGKARGLAFMNAMLAEYNVYEKFEGVRVEVPPMTVIGTEIFDTFLEVNSLHELALGNADDATIASAFLAARLPDNVRDDLEVYLRNVTWPMAVRSSSLLEDSQYQAFAGIYRTNMLANNHTDLRVRLDHLCAAIKLVFASTFFRASKAYVRATGNRMEEEKMAVILQRLVGESFKGRAYPSFSGVAHSYNYYPVTGMKAGDGVALVALGLGKMVVEEGNWLRFSPRTPQTLPQFASASDVLENSQRDFYALDTSDPDLSPTLDPDANMRRFDLSAAMADGSLSHVGSIYSPENDTIYDGVHRNGVPLVTFAHVLKTGIFPLAEILSYLLEMGKAGMGCPVEMEFAVNMDRPKGKPSEFGVLQIRPMSGEREGQNVDLSEIEKSATVCTTTAALGSGSYENVRDVIYVRPDKFEASTTVTIADQVGRINGRLRDEERPYLLIGPGRWGTSDPWLGIPVDWDQISEARVIIETDLKEFKVAPSQGTHFFQNLTAFQIGYFTVRRRREHNYINWGWLAGHESEGETEYVRHLRLSSPLDIRIDGHSGHGVIFKP